MPPIALDNARNSRFDTVDQALYDLLSDVQQLARQLYYTVYNSLRHGRNRIQNRPQQALDAIDKTLYPLFTEVQKSVDGKFFSVLLMAFKTFPAAPFTAPTIAVIPFLNMVIIVLPRSSQLNAMNTDTMASIICGILSTSVGMAFTSPTASWPIRLAAVATSLGALSLMIPAILVTISGTLSISAGRLWMMPRPMLV